jgi:hypothetical protein
MSRNRTIAFIGVLLAAVALLAATGPAIAHPAAPVTAPALPTPDVAVPPVAARPVLAIATSSDSAGFAPWIVAGAVVLAGAVLRRRPRRSLLLGLVLLLTLFAFENALHSVHHGLDAKQADVCTIASASTHLSAVAVDGVVETSVTLVAAGPATEPDVWTLPARWLGPDQGRAPPAPIA